MPALATPTAATPARRTPTLPRPGGLALIEVLIATALLGLGSVALMRLHLHLRHGSEVARQRAEALRLAEEDLETLRAYTRLDSGGGSGAGGGGGSGAAWSAIGNLAAQEVTDLGGPTVYTRSRSVSPAAAPALKSVTSTLAWTDRHGEARQLRLPTLVAGLDPALIGALLLRRGDGRGLGALGRHPLIPVTARELGDGRIAYKPRASGTLTWVFDAATAQVTARCQSPAGLASADLTAAQLSGCRAISGLLLAGVLRFATQGDTLRATDAENPLDSAMDLDLRLSLSSTGHPDPAWECEDDAPDGAPPAVTAQTVVHYACVVQPAGNPPQWSGRLDVVPRGWAIADAGDGALRICRYSADHDGNGRIDNREHPLRYAGVGEPLGDQNFLVVRAAAGCPRDAPASMSVPANWVDDSTVAHQP
jgi:Tfp pilus assembly protein PilV